MQKKDCQFHPVGICQRFFNLISRFIAPMMPSSSTEGPVMNGVCSIDRHDVPKSTSKLSKEEKVNHLDQKTPKDENSGSALEIHFKQTEEDLEYWTPIDKLGSSILVDYDPPKFKKSDGGASRTPSTVGPAEDKAKEKDKVSEPSPARDNTKEKKSRTVESSPAKGKEKKSKISESAWKEEFPIVQANGISLPQGIRSDRTSQGKGFQETPQVAQGRGKQRVVIRENKGKNIASEEISVPIQVNGQTKRSPENILSANINEKSDEFLKSRLETMRET